MFNLAGMDLKQIRLSNLGRYLKNECSENAAELARRIKRSPSQVNDLFAGRKSFGEKFARAIEKDMGVIDGWLDTPSDEKKSATATLALSVNLSETGLSAGAARLVRLIRQHDKAGTLSPALIQAIEQMMLAATPPKDEAPAQEGRTTPQPPTDMPPKTEPGNEIGYTPNMSQYDPTKKRVAKKPKSQTA